ncbi:hypothetical protein IWQ49_004290 [Labrenzia sp. EL_126]|nr:hypothetical protein [Labrenzia sp. EL_126]
MQTSLDWRAVFIICARYVLCRDTATDPGYRPLPAFVELTADRATVLVSPRSEGSLRAGSFA